MNCESFRTVVHEIDQPSCLESAMLDAAWGHAQSCARCARRLARARELAAALAALAQVDRHKQPSLWLEVQLIRDFRVHSAGVRSASRTILRWWMAAAAILALTIGAGLAWRRASRHARSKTSPVASNAYPGLAPTPAQAIAPASGAVTVKRPRHSSRVAGTVAARPESESIAELAEFLPLPFADDDWSLGAAEVVRIRLSESALGVLGLPVSDEASRLPVTADVVIGEDGEARAIRFVSGPVPSEVIQQLQTTAFEAKGAKP
jgi:hypothetical protein